MLPKPVSTFPHHSPLSTPINEGRLFTLRPRHGSSILKAHGFEVKDEEIGRQKPSKKCGRYHAENSPLVQFCHRCGLALDMKDALELDRKAAAQVEGLDSLKGEIATLKEELTRQKAFKKYVQERLGTHVDRD